MYPFSVCTQPFHSSVLTLSSWVRVEAGSSAFEGKSLTCFRREMRTGSLRLGAGSSRNIRKNKAAAVSSRQMAFVSNASGWIKSYDQGFSSYPSVQLLFAVVFWPEKTPWRDYSIARAMCDERKINEQKFEVEGERGE